MRSPHRKPASRLRAWSSVQIVLETIVQRLNRREIVTGFDVVEVNDLYFKSLGHGFFYHDRGAYRQQQAMDGWEKVYAWFEKYLS